MSENLTFNIFICDIGMNISYVWNNTSCIHGQRLVTEYILMKGVNGMITLTKKLKDSRFLLLSIAFSPCQIII
jgi:hypothetical protein